MAEPILFQQPAVTSLDKSKKIAIGKAGAITETITITLYEANLDTTFGLGTMGTNISTLQGQMTTANGKISTLEGKVSTLEGKVSTLEGKVNTLEGEMDTAQGDIIDLQSALGTLDPWHIVGSDAGYLYNTGWNGASNKLAFRKVNPTTVAINGEAYADLGAPSLVWRLPAGYRPIAALYRTAIIYGTQTILTVTIDTDGYFYISDVAGAYYSFWCDFQFRIS